MMKIERTVVVLEANKPSEPIKVPGGINCFDTIMHFGHAAAPEKRRRLHLLFKDGNGNEVGSNVELSEGTSTSAEFDRDSYKMKLISEEEEPSSFDTIILTSTQDITVELKAEVNDAIFE